VTTLLPLDYDTLAVGDKFGNLSVLRLPADVSAQVRRVAWLRLPSGLCSGQLCDGSRV